MCEGRTDLSFSILGANFNVGGLMAHPNFGKTFF